MKLLKCRNEKTNKNGHLEIDGDSYTLITTTHSIGVRKRKYIGKSKRQALRYFNRKGWKVLPVETNNLDIAVRKVYTKDK